jgi:hypothetical protein
VKTSRKYQGKMKIEDQKERGKILWIVESWKIIRNKKKDEQYLARTS